MTPVQNHEPAVNKISNYTNRYYVQMEKLSNQYRGWGEF